MDKIEEVKKILNSLDPNSPISFGRVTREICQLFEPKPDESRLLTEEEIGAIKARCRYPVGDEGRIGRTGVESRAKFYSTDNKKLRELLAKTQDAKTASIKDAEITGERKRAYVSGISHGEDNCKQELCLAKSECQARIEALIEWIAKVNKIAWYTERYPKDYGCNIGPEDWQILKATHTSKGDEG